MKPSNLVIVLISLCGLSAWAQAPSTCAPGEADSIYRQAESNTLDRVRQDMRVEGRVSASALGYDDQDCLRQAYERANYRRQEAIDSCVSQTRYFHSCEIVDRRPVGAPQRIIPIMSSGHVDERKIDENNCRISAQNQAIQNALSRCQSQFGTQCRIASGPSTASHRTETRRRYGIVGPKEEYHICDSQAEAIPDSNLQTQCAIELVAKVRL